MKKIKYSIVCGIKPDGTEILMDKTIPYAEENLVVAETEAYNGEYEIFDDGQPDPAATPSQLDVIEAQVAYTAMMTDTLLEV